MTQQHLFIPGPLPGLNELILAKGTRRRGIGYRGMKRQWEADIMMLIRKQKLKPVKTPALLTFEWSERNKRRDKDNVAAGGRKFILDALVKCGILCDDGWRGVSSWTDQFCVNREDPGVVLTITTTTQEGVR